jgi:hypothetical protein
MAQILFLANLSSATEEAKTINHTAGSGIGFYGSDFAVSIPIGTQNQKTFVTDANGVNQGVALNNTSYANDSDNRGRNPGQAGISDGGIVELNQVANKDTPLNIRFKHDSSVKCQNPKLRVFDRNNINNHASGVVTYAYEVRHPALENTSDGALAHRSTDFSDHKWFVFEKGVRMLDADTGNNVVEDMPLTQSPGLSGLNTSIGDNKLNGVPQATTLGASHNSLQHDWYLALSSEPTEIGAKTQYGLYFSVEYL